jgi:hypothetical protein
MFGDLLKILGSYLSGQVRRIALTIILLVSGTVAIVLALGMGFWALYLWLQLELGTFAALGILGGTFALSGLLLLAVAFLREKRRHRRAPRESALVAMDDVAADVQRKPRQSVIVAILLAMGLGWIVGRRMKR